MSGDLIGELRGEIAELRSRLEHAESALTGDSEGCRLWMLDCGALVQKHRDRAEGAEAEVQRLVSQIRTMQQESHGTVTISLADLRTIVAMAEDYARFDARNAGEEQAYARLAATAAEAAPCPAPAKP